VLHFYLRCPTCVTQAFHANPCRGLIVAGGDGTLSQAVNGLSTDFNACEFAVLPTGPANDSARTMQLPRDLDAAMHLAWHGNSRAIAPARCHWRLHLPCIAGKQMLTDVQRFRTRAVEARADAHIGKSGVCVMPAAVRVMLVRFGMVKSPASMWRPLCPATPQTSANGVMRRADKPSKPARA